MERQKHPEPEPINPAVLTAIMWIQISKILESKRREEFIENMNA